MQQTINSTLLINNQTVTLLDDRAVDGCWVDEGDLADPTWQILLPTGLWDDTYEVDNPSILRGWLPADRCRQVVRFKYPDRMELVEEWYNEMLEQWVLESPANRLGIKFRQRFILKDQEQEATEYKQAYMRIMKHSSGLRRQEELDMFANCPDYIPFEMLDEEQAMRNHSQSLAKLNSRGGIGVGEAIDIIKKQRWATTKDSHESVDEFISLYNQFLSRESVPYKQVTKGEGSIRRLKTKLANDNGYETMQQVFDTNPELYKKLSIESDLFLSNIPTPSPKSEWMTLQECIQNVIDKYEISWHNASCDMIDEAAELYANQTINRGWVKIAEAGWPKIDGFYLTKRVDKDTARGWHYNESLYVYKPYPIQEKDYRKTGWANVIEYKLVEEWTS